MTQTAEKLRDEVLRLSTEERAEIAYCLISSLDENEPDIHDAWEAELERRWREVESGEVVGESAESVFVELRKKYP